MTKRTKKRVILAALLAFALIISALMVVAYAENENKKVLLNNWDYQKNTSFGYAGKAWAQETLKTNGDGNIYSSITHKDPKNYTKKSDGTYDKTDSFYDIKVCSYGAAKKTISQYEYLTIDFDFMTETGWYYDVGSIGMRAICRAYVPTTDKNGNTVGSYSTGGPASNNMNVSIDKVSNETKWALNAGGKLNEFNNPTKAKYNWQHISFVLDVSYSEATGYNKDETMYYVYLNGNLVETGKFFTSASLNDPESYYSSTNDMSLIYFDTIRVGHDHKSSIEAENYNDKFSFCIDNVIVNGYEKGYVGTGAAPAIEPVYNEAYDMPRGFVLARINDKYYDDRDAAVAAINAASVEGNEIELFADFNDTALFINAPITIKKNGHAINYTKADSINEFDDGNGTLTYTDKFKVIWHFGNETTEKYYSYGETPVPPYTLKEGELITVDGTVYIQRGKWSATGRDGEALESFPTVSKNTDYYATYSDAVKITWHFGDESDSKYYVKGTIPTPLYTPVAGEHIIANGETHKQTGGWSTTSGGAKLDSIPAAESDAEYFATYEETVYYFAYKTSENSDFEYFESTDITITNEANRDEEISSAVYEKLYSIINGNSYSSVKLMSDIIVHGNIKTKAGNSKDDRTSTYIDLAGFHLTFTAITGDKYYQNFDKDGNPVLDKDGNYTYSTAWGALFTPKATSLTAASYSTLNVFSSIPGGKLFNSAYNVGTFNPDGTLFKDSTTLSGVSLFGANENSIINIGALKVDGKTIYDGNNLSGYGPTLYYGGANAQINVDGGAYYKSIGDQGSLIVLTGNSTVNIKNALISGGKYPIFKSYDKKDIVYNFKLNVDGSILHSTSYYGFDSWHSGAELIITNSYVCTNLNLDEVAINAGKVTFGSGVRVMDSYIITGVTNADGVESNINTAEPFGFTINTNEFAYILNESDREHSTYDKAASETTTAKQISDYIAYTTASASDYDTISWTYNGTTTNPEKWFRGVVPTRPFALDDGNGYKFVVNGLKPAVGGKTVNYVIEQKADIPMLMNISLYADFVYNIYIPTEYKNVITGAVLNGHKADLIQTTKINGKEYYVLQLPITAANGAQSFALELTLKGHEGKSFTDTYTLSIPKYAYTVLDGNYIDSTKDLMRYTLAYIKAACNYFGTASDEIGEVISVGEAEAAPMGNVPESIADVFSGAQLYLGGEIKFRFNVIAEGEFNATFEYFDSSINETVTKNITEADVLEDKYGRHYDIALRAYDLCSDIKVTVGDGSFTYSLANYVHFVRNHPALTEDANLNALLNSLWSYSVAAKGYDPSNGNTHYETITICDTPIEQFSIVANSTAEENAAAILRHQIFLKTGHELPIVRSTDGKAIIINNKMWGINDFAVSVVDGNLVFDTCLQTFILDGMINFARDHITSINEAFNFKSDFSAAYSTSFINYRDMGAVADGIADDHDAMKLAHELANKKGYIVKVNEGKYNVGKHTDPIIIMTDVDWTGATIITDDSKINVGDAERTADLFKIKSDYTARTIDANSELVKLINSEKGITSEILEKYNGTFFNYDPGYRAMLVPYNADHMVYIRYGANESDGAFQHELIIIEEDGQINEDTPFLLDYEKVSYINEYRVDDTPITITGGEFITIANQAPCEYNYYSRGISIERSNTTIRGLKHFIKGEGDSGAPYGGFIGVLNCTDFLAEGCELQGHRYYMAPNETGMGTYDIGGNNANNMVFKDCVQRNFNASNTWYDENGNTGSRNDDPAIHSGIWGIMGSNWCKNITYDHSKLSRLDAHSGVVNASVINGSEVTTIAAIGGGTLLVENSTVHGAYIINSRVDYGSTWKGDLIIRNVTFHNTNATPQIINGSWSNHYFGYTTYMPTNIVIDGLKFTGTLDTPYILSGFIPKNVDAYDKDTGAALTGLTGVTGNFDISKSTFTYGGTTYMNKNPMVMPESITISGVTNSLGNEITPAEFKGSSNTYLDALLKGIMK